MSEWTTGFGIVAMVIMSYWFFFAGRRRFVRQPSMPRAVEQNEVGMLQTVHFAAIDGNSIEGWLVLPRYTSAPVIIMAPGLTGTKEGSLETFAWRFVEAGYAVLMFDFRSFGGSDGEPRHWLDPVRQVEDYQAAIVYLRNSSNPGLDVARIVLWGSSFSASAAVCAAARDACISAVIAQVPYLGGLPVHPPGRLQIARYVALSVGEVIGDTVVKPFGVTLAPAYITTYGKPGESTFAMSRDNPSCEAPTRNLHPFWAAQPESPRGGWENRMLVRGLARLDAISAADEMANVSCPILLIGALQDDMVAFENIQLAAATHHRDGNRLQQADCGHYDLYVAPRFDANVSSQIAFLRDTVGVTAPATHPARTSGAAHVTERGEPSCS